MLSSAYGVSLGEKLAEHKDWIKMHGLLIGEAKNSELARADYSVHARLREPLGIAIAELVDAGAVVFTPSDGGQFEVVNEIAELGYSSEDDAVEKIARVLDSSEMQVNLSNRLLAGLERFEPSRFNEAVRAEVASLISSHDQKKDACPGANLVVGVGAARLLGAKGKE
jgi:hypothetical protein